MDEKFMKEAIKQAKKAALLDEVPVGCVIVKGGKIIARAHNLKEKKHSSLYHAEINALLKAAKVIGDWRLSDCEMYVTLEPCLMCVGAIVNYRVGTVYYGAKDPNGGAIVSNLNISTVKLNYYPVFEGGIMAEECGKVLSEYFKTKRAKK